MFIRRVPIESQFFIVYIVYIFRLLYTCCTYKYIYIYIYIFTYHCFSLIRQKNTRTTIMWWVYYHIIVSYTEYVLLDFNIFLYLLFFLRTLEEWMNLNLGRNCFSVSQFKWGCVANIITILFLYHCPFHWLHLVWLLYPVLWITFNNMIQQLSASKSIPQL